jgi:hypothetical protein
MMAGHGDAKGAARESEFRPRSPAAFLRASGDCPPPGIGYPHHLYRPPAGAHGLRCRRCKAVKHQATQHVVRETMRQQDRFGVAVCSRANCGRADAVPGAARGRGSVFVGSSLCAGRGLARRWTTSANLTSAGGQRLRGDPSFGLSSRANRGRSREQRDVADGWLCGALGRFELPLGDRPPRWPRLLGFP